MPLWVELKQNLINLLEGSRRMARINPALPVANRTEDERNREENVETEDGKLISRLHHRDSILELEQVPEIGPAKDHGEHECRGKSRNQMLELVAESGPHIQRSTEISDR